MDSAIDIIIDIREYWDWKLACDVTNHPTFGIGWQTL